tara:strand:+ start:874 stop:1404 length:531 start_codon:yes stop_codon:yes gene_type:complete
MEKLISYYPNGIMLKKGINNYPEKYIDFNDLIKIMKSDNLKIQINNLRKFEYKSCDYNYYKKRLPVVLFNKFKYNLNDGILQENFIKPFDVDFIDNSKLQIKIFKEQIKKESIFVIDSPSGKGIKFFIKKLFNTLDPYLYYEKYKELCRLYEKKYNIRLDYAQGRIKQPFFLTYIN